MEKFRSGISGINIPGFATLVVTVVGRPGGGREAGPF
jgi:hypothetical protein